MGLDMYVYRITKLTEEEQKEVQGMSYDGLCETDFTVHDYLDEDESLLAPIKDYIMIVTKPVENIHYDLLKKVCNIPEDAECCGWGGGVVMFRREGDSHTYKVEHRKLTEEQLKQCTATDMITFAVFKEQKVLYWRKDYILQSKLHGAYKGIIENCGYYPLNAKMKKEINDALRRAGREGEICDLEPTEDSVACYHEWY